MECIICKEDIHKHVTACVPCGHVFHLNCLGNWLTEHSICPFCRKVFGLQHMQFLYLRYENISPEEELVGEEIRRKWLINSQQEKPLKITIDQPPQITIDCEVCQHLAATKKPNCCSSNKKNVGIPIAVVILAFIFLITFVVANVLFKN